MTSYSVYSGSVLIGHSDLELGDSSMGVALGKFRPTSAYAAVRGACISALGTGAWDALDLALRTSDGLDIPAQGGVMILDGVELDETELEVQAAGISHPLYAQVFPHLVGPLDSSNA